jgi:3-carboxy-cis,cis-muconate cycloisomerase
VAAELLGAIVVTDELAEATGDRAWLAALLDAEVALARAEAEVGVIPAAAAEAIAAAAALAVGAAGPAGVAAGEPGAFAPAALGRAARLAGNPVPALVDALVAAAGPDAGGWVHWGATSQDIMDTAEMLVARRALAVIEADLTELADGCATLAEAHRHTVMAGRTLLQQALPTTFGLVAAGWLVGAYDARGQVRAARDGLAAQLGGAVGTLASLGPAGPEVAARFARHVGLADPGLPWHTARQRIAALAGALAMAAGTAAKISGDIAMLMQTEVGEVSEPAAPGRGGSSTLPHKRNPVAAAAVGAAARQALGLLPVLYGSLLAEHQRPVGAWQAEWESLSSLLALAGSAVAHAAATVTGLEVHPEAMAANLGRTRGLLMAERVSLALAAAADDDGAVVGRPAAKAAVGQASRLAVETGRSLGEALAEEPLVARHFTAEEVQGLLEPAGYLGSTQAWIDRALAIHANTGPGGAA